MPEEPDLDLLQWIAAQCTSTILDEGAGGRLREVMEFRPEGGGTNWGVVDVANPIQALMKRLAPATTEDPSIRARLAYGRRKGEEARFWFQRLQGYIGSEGSVDCALGGLPGVRGRVDFRLSQSIIELKTTRYEMEEPSQAFDVAPQDLEQLAIYILSTSRERDEHFLVYFHEGSPTPFRCFSVRIQKPEALRQYFKARLAGLKFAWERRDPSSLGRCRYFERGCNFRLAKLCPCESRPEIDVGPLRDCLQLVRAPKLQVELLEASKSPRPPSEGRFSAWELFVPRKAYASRVGIDIVERPMRDQDYQFRLDAERRLVRSTAAADRFDLSLTGTDGQPRRLRGLGISTVLLASTRDGPRDAILPTIVRVPGSPVPFRTDNFPDVYKSQLGVHCAIRTLSEGLVILLYPTHPGELQCFRLRFEQIGAIRAKLNQRLAAIETSINRSTPTELVTCPDFVRKSCGTGCLCAPAPEPPPEGKPASRTASR
jgi:hypothetical protein